MTGFFSGVLLTEDYFYAAALALIFTWIVYNVSKFFGAIMKRPTEFGFRSRDLTKVINKCYLLFPNEIVHFRGETFKRGMNVRVTTVSKKTFEGELIGLNNDNIFCVLTENFIAADVLDNVTEMTNIPKK